MNIPRFLNDGFLASLAHSQQGQGVVVPSLRSIRENCTTRCADDPDPAFCECLCRNSHCSGGRCIPQPCWPTF
jgi:hypothetical protein